MPRGYPETTDYGFYVEPTKPEPVAINWQDYTKAGVIFGVPLGFIITGIFMPDSWWPYAITGAQWLVIALAVCTVGVVFLGILFALFMATVETLAARRQNGKKWL